MLLELTSMQDVLVLQRKQSRKAGAVGLTYGSHAYYPKSFATELHPERVPNASVPKCLLHHANMALVCVAM